RLVGSLGIQDHYAVALDNNNSVSVVDVGTKNFDVSVLVSKVGQNTGIVLANDLSNFYRFGFYPDLRFQKVVNGVVSNVSTLSFISESEMVLRLVVNNGVFDLYYNDELITTVNDSDILNYQKVGM